MIGWWEKLCEDAECCGLWGFFCEVLFGCKQMVGWCADAGGCEAGGSQLSAAYGAFTRHFSASGTCLGGGCRGGVSLEGGSGCWKTESEMGRG
jgi:hypothetical protein